MKTAFVGKAEYIVRDELGSGIASIMPQLTHIHYSRKGHNRPNCTGDDNGIIRGKRGTKPVVRTPEFGEQAGSVWVRFSITNLRYFKIFSMVDNNRIRETRHIAYGEFEASGKRLIQSGVLDAMALTN
jgi:hypothetical protein